MKINLILSNEFAMLIVLNDKFNMVEYIIEIDLFFQKAFVNVMFLSKRFVKK